MSGPHPLPHLSCRTCDRSNPWVYFALVVVEGTRACICMDCGSGRKPQAGSSALTPYEIRDNPDDLPIICATLAEAERRGIEVLIYEMHPTRGERFIGAI